MRKGGCRLTMVRFEPHNDQDVANSPRAYRITDHLGSAVAVHRVGAVNPWLHRQFAAFGATVNANAGGGALAGFAVWTDRGFTGHESVQSAGIVHMKGRIYDPELGRFLQADPFVQAPDNSQSLNRYSYVLNNPLSYTDPSGFFVKALVTDIFPAVFSIVGCASGQIYVCAGAATSASAFTSAATGQPFLKAVRDGAIAGVTAVAFVQVGTAVDAGKLSKEAAIAVHGAIGAGAAAARGGDPLAGFAAAVLTKSFTLGAEGFLDQINNDAIESLIAGAVGGTISEVTGGKFANGAVTAAIGYAYNQVLHSTDSNINRLEPGTKAYAREEARILNEDGGIRYSAVKKGDIWTVQPAHIAGAESAFGTTYAESVFDASSPAVCATFCTAIGGVAAATFGDFSDSQRADALNTAQEAREFTNGALDVLRESPNDEISRLANKVSRLNIPLRLGIAIPAAINNTSSCYASCRSRFFDR